MSITKRVTYLKGLAEGLGLGRDTKEEKILHIMMEILDDMALELRELKEEVVSLDEDMSLLSEGVEDLEDFLYEESEEDDEPCACPMPHVHPMPSQPVAPPMPPSPPSPNGGQIKASVPSKPTFYSLVCPSCSNEITVDDDVLALGAIDCPNCGERLEFDLDDEE